jgi:hypothetical protein
MQIEVASRAMVARNSAYSPLKDESAASARSKAAVSPGSSDPSKWAEKNSLALFAFIVALPV